MSYIYRSIGAAGPLLKSPGSRVLSIALTATGAGGSPTTFIDTTRLTQAENAAWVGAVITFTNGEEPPAGNLSVTRTITAFNASTRTLTWVGDLDVAIATADTATIVYGPKTGPSKIRLYSVTTSATISSLTTGLILTIQDCATSPAALSKWYFATPITAATSYSATANFGQRGVVIDVPMGINAVPVYSGSGSTILSTDIVYDWEPGELTDDQLGMGLIGDNRGIRR